MLEITVHGVHEARTLLDDIADRVQHTSPAFDTILDRVFDTQQEWWASQGRGSWPPLHEATRERDAREGTDPRPVIETGALLAAATRRGSGGQTVKVADDSLLFSIDLAYAADQANSGRSPLAEFTSRDAERYADTLLDYLVHGRR